MLSSRKAPPSPGGAPVAKPRTTIQLPPRAESPVRPSNAPCPNVSREPQSEQNACHVPRVAPGRAAGQGSAQADVSHGVGPDAPDVSQDSTSFVLGPRSPGAGRQPQLIANEGEGVRLQPGLPRAPVAVDHRGLDGSTMETTTPP
jgi:hypothetical protein